MDPRRLVLPFLTMLAGCAVGEPTDRRFEPFQDDGLALTPPMGWSSWNAFGCEIDEDLIRAQADALVDTGLRDLGYVHLNIDDCWQAEERGADGSLAADPERFPGGIPALADYAHERGLKLGIYSSPGETTCDDLPGSLGFEEDDAQQFAAWGVDYLKFDRCSASEDEVIDGFIAMRGALVRTGRPIVLSVNPNGAVWDRPWSDVAHLWRTTPDIKATYSEECSWKCGVIEIVDLNEPVARDSGPGGWNDPDMLEVGVSTEEYPGLTAGETRLHFSLWAMMAAPLIAGADLAALPDDALAVYGNAEIVAVDQDALGVQGWRARNEGDGEVWVKPLADPGARAVAMVNRSEGPRLVTARWSELLLVEGPAAVRDLWAHRDLGTFEDAFTAEIPAHDVVMLRVLGTADSSSYEAESLDNALLGGAKVARCPACSGAQKVGYDGNGSTLRFNAIHSGGGARRLVIAYATGEERFADLRIGAAPPVRIRFPSTGGFDAPGELTIPVELTAGETTIELTNPDDWAPDFDRIAVE